MKKTFFVLFVLIYFIPLFACSSPEVSSSSSWAYTFVSYKGNMYKVTDTEVSTVGRELGRVTFEVSNEDMREELDGLVDSNTRQDTEHAIFSHGVPIGTSIYEMEEASSEEKIAIKNKNGTYSIAESNSTQ